MNHIQNILTLYVSISKESGKTDAFACLVCGLMSQSTAMVMSRGSVNLTTLFLGKL